MASNGCDVALFSPSLTYLVSPLFLFLCLSFLPFLFYLMALPYATRENAFYSDYHSEKIAFQSARIGAKVSFCSLSPFSLVSLTFRIYPRPITQQARSLGRQSHSNRLWKSTVRLQFHNNSVSCIPSLTSIYLISIAFPRVDFLKFDLEGLEFPFLDGVDIQTLSDKVVQVGCHSVLCCCTRSHPGGI